MSPCFKWDSGTYVGITLGWGCDQVFLPLHINSVHIKFTSGAGSYESAHLTPLLQFISSSHGSPTPPFTLTTPLFVF